MTQQLPPHEIQYAPGARPQMPVNAQTWQQLSLFHWPVPAKAVQALLPKGLVVDCYEGQSWLGVVPFVMADVRVPPLPAIGRSSRFAELNVRVYVHDFEGNRGVWFLGLWCESSSFVLSARALGLPYHRVTSQVSGVAGAQRAFEYQFRRTDAANPSTNIQFEATVHPDAAIDASTGLEAWLTARWNMFAFRAGQIWRYPVHHEPWQLRSATAHELATNAHQSFGFELPTVAPLVHMAEPVHTLVGAPRLNRS